MSGNKGDRRILKINPLAQSLANNAATTAGSVTTVDVNWRLFRVPSVPLIGDSDASRSCAKRAHRNVDPILKILLTIYVVVHRFKYRFHRSALRSVFSFWLSGRQVIVALLARHSHIQQEIDAATSSETIPMSGTVWNRAYSEAQRSDSSSQFDDVEGAGASGTFDGCRGTRARALVRGAFLGLRLCVFLGSSPSHITIGFFMSLTRLTS